MFSRSSTCLALTLLFALTLNVYAQTTTPGQAQPTAQSGQAQTKPATEQEPPAPTDKKKSERKGRQPRQPRTSTREPLSNSPRGSFEEQRPSRDPGPVRQDISLATNIQGGYDDNLTAGLGAGGGSSVNPNAMASGGTAVMDTALNFFRGNRRQSFRADTGANVTGYPGYMRRPGVGGNVSVAGTTTLGQLLNLSVSERASYEPYFSVLPTGAITQVPTVADLYMRRSASSNTSVTLEERWSRSNWTSLSYSYNLRSYTDGAYGNSTGHTASASYRGRVAGWMRVRGDYRFEDRENGQTDGFTMPTRIHRVEIGPEFETVFSRRRSLSFSFTGGAARMESVVPKTREPYQATVPVGRASGTFRFSPTWSLEGSFGREFQQLYGVTNNMYATDTGSLSFGGLIGLRTNVRVGGNYSNMNTAYVPGVDERMRIYGGFLSVRLAITEMLAATANYYYYQHVYSDPSALPSGFPPKYNRNAVRVGLSLFVPLSGVLKQPSSAVR